MYETTEQILASLEQCYKNGEITNFLSSFSDRNMDLVRKGEYKGRKFYELYPQLVVYEADGNHSYNAKIGYRGIFEADDGHLIGMWVEDTIEFSVMKVNAMLGIDEAYATVKFAENSPFLTDDKKKLLIQTAEKNLSMRVEEIK